MSAEPSWLELCRVQPRFNNVKGSTPEDGGRSLSPGEGYRCGSRGAFLFSFLQKPIRPIRPIRLIRGRTEISRGQVFILVYRLAMDAKTLRGDGVAG